MEPSKIIVIGLGNPILGDDGVGWQVGELVQKRIHSSPDGFAQVEVECVAEGGLRLMEIMVGYDYAIIIDALTTAQNPFGTVMCCPLEALPDLTNGHIASPHNTSLQTALKLGREMNLYLPRSVMIVGVEAQKVYDISDQLTTPVQEAVPQAVRVVMDMLEDLISDE